MVQIIKKSILLACAATLVSAQSLLTPISYTGTLDVYYYFLDSDAIAVPSDEGITVEGTFSSTEELCQVLNNGQIVYSTPQTSNVLLTSNCYNVFNLVDSENQVISWDSCEEYPFYQSLCETESSSTTASTTTTTTQSTTGTVSSTATTESSSLTTVTTTISGVVTTYTTYCPLSSESSTLTTVTTTIDGIVTSYTTYCPLTSDSTSTKGETSTTIKSTITQSGTTSVSTGSAVVGTPVRVSVTDVESYRSYISSVSEQSKSAAAAASSESTVLVAGGSTKTQTVAGSSSAAAVSTFEGNAGRITGSLSVIYIVGSIAALLL